jgi:hypothetical protein
MLCVRTILVTTDANVGLGGPEKTVLLIWTSVPLTIHARTPRCVRTVLGVTIAHAQKATLVKIAKLTNRRRRKP